MVASHSSLHYHRHCLEIADALKSSVDNPVTRVDVMFGSAIQKQINDQNKQIIRQIVRAILFLAKQGCYPK